MLRSNECRRSKLEKRKSPPQQARAEGTPSLLEKKKKKKIASADDDMIWFHRLSRKNFPSGFWGRWKKSASSEYSASALLKRDRGNRHSSKVRQRGGGYSHSLSILSCIVHVRYDVRYDIYLLNPTRNLWPDYSSVVPFYAVKPRFHSPLPPLVDTVCFSLVILGTMGPTNCCMAESSVQQRKRKIKEKKRSYLQSQIP